MIDAPEVRVVRWVFLRALGAIYLVAFVSLWFQIRGLIGADGILPVRDLMGNAGQFVGAHQIGLDRYRLLPTLSWISSSDSMLIAQCALGAALALLVLIDLVPGPALVGLWLLYLSLTVVGQDFLGFQWDNLLLEAGLLAMVFAPWRLGWAARNESPPSRVALWLLRWLLCRLMFESGCVKLLSGDPTWRNLTSLTVHYQTQPLPTWIAWYMHQLPESFQRASCFVMFAVELGAPFLIFTPRRLRFAGAAAMAGLQILILLTGNYTFFNYLTLALCLLLLDDRAIRRFVPIVLRRRLDPDSGDDALQAAVSSVRQMDVRRLIAPIALAAIVLPVSLLTLTETLGSVPEVLSPVAGIQQWLAPLRSINGYGLFAVMTTTRNEIIVEGSDDGATWKAYEFRDKPGDPMRRPAFVAPHQPRLDWQMWFAALGSSASNPWFTNFCVRLLQGSPAVIGLLAANPFPDRPPKFVRAELYDYRFTTWPERKATGAWWTRTPSGEYLAPISLR